MTPSAAWLRDGCFAGATFATVTTLTTLALVLPSFTSGAPEPMAGLADGTLWPPRDSDHAAPGHARDLAAAVVGLAQAVSPQSKQESQVLGVPPSDRYNGGVAHHLSADRHIDLTETYSAHSYHPLPVVIASAQGAWMTDVEGTRYLDCLAGYSALNFGHSHPRLVQRAAEQLSILTLTSRAFYNDQLGGFAHALATLTGKEMILPMNTGAEAVETAIKVSRRWGYQVKGVPEGSAQIIVMDGNFHGRTTTIVGFSDDVVARATFGPFTPGFNRVKYGMKAAVEEAITAETVAVLLEPIQGEGGVVIPPEGYLREVRSLCDEHGILMIADEVQSGLARTGRTFACDHEGVVPDVYVMGKALGGGLYPVSAIAADRHIMAVIVPGSHGSTFGGNPLAAAIGHEVVTMLAEGTWQQRSAQLGDHLAERLNELIGSGITEIRLRGLWAGVDIDPALMSGRQLCERLMSRGVLAKDTHGSTIRLAPPLVSTTADLDFLVATIADVLAAG